MATKSKKRASEGGNSPAQKRRKASTMSASSSAHPLRQTSFPPDESQSGTPNGARSPSIDSMSLVSGSQVSAAAPAKKKRGRKSKAEKAREQTPSVAGGTAATTVSGGASDVGRGSKRGGYKGGAAGEDDEEDADGGVVEVAATAQARTAEQKAEEHRLRGMLINAFTPDQFDRYENWRAAGLSKNAVKRVSFMPRTRHSICCSVH